MGALTDRAASGNRRGSVLMEFVLVMPILFMLIMLILQFAQIMVVRQFVAYAAYCSTRSMLCSNPSEWDNDDKTENCARQAARRVLAWVNVFGKQGSGREVAVPGWGRIPESSSVDKRLDIPREEMKAVPGKYATSTVHYKFPLLVPVAGQMISFLAKHSAEESRYVKSKTLIPGWTGEQELFDGVPYIELTETCVLPLPHSTEELPTAAFDYTSYD